MTLPMSWNEWAQHDAVGLAARVRGGDVTPKELARQAAAGIAQGRSRAVGCRRGVRRRDRRSRCDGANLGGPFAGVPYLMKDLGPTLKGRLQEMGSLYARQPGGGRQLSCGAVSGKPVSTSSARTTTPEFGVCSSADNPAVYVTRNPWNTDYTTCGSSAGSGDGRGGRRADRACAPTAAAPSASPAGVNGIIGSKLVTRRLLDRAGSISDLTGLVSIQGCQSRSVRDTAAFVDACRGPRAGRIHAVLDPAEPYQR